MQFFCGFSEFILYAGWGGARDTFRFGKIIVSFWKFATLRFADCNYTEIETLKRKNF